MCAFCLQMAECSSVEELLETSLKVQHYQFATEEKAHDEAFLLEFLIIDLHRH